MISAALNEIYHRACFGDLERREAIGRVNHRHRDTVAFVITEHNEAALIPAKGSQLPGYFGRTGPCALRAHFAGQTDVIAQSSLGRIAHQSVRAVCSGLRR
jgi:hypothetical protein